MQTKHINIHTHYAHKILARINKIRHSSVGVRGVFRPLVFECVGIAKNMQNKNKTNNTAHLKTKESKNNAHHTKYK